MSSTAWLLFATCAVVGHVVVMRALLNRGYELGLPQRLWQALAVSVIACAIAGAIIIARVTRHRRWDDLPSGWQAYLAFCIAALFVGAIVLWRRSKDSHVTAQIATSSDVLHFASMGNRRGLAALPGNEIFTVEIIERQIRMPRLPAALDGLSILHITDLHMNGVPGRDFFEWAAQRCAQQNADLVAMTGDMMDHLGVLDWLPTTLGAINAPLGRFFVLGNHDLHAGGDAMRHAMEKLGWQSVAGRVVTEVRSGARVVISGTEQPWAGGAPPIDGSPAPADEFRILLSHAPHLVHWARRRHVDLVLAGHLHGGQIQWPLIGPVAGGRLHSGLFDMHPTILHVGRGLGQMAPVRYGCRPEITKLILRATTPPAGPRGPAAA
jgi:predicted MPP superfamily phosphohydrolase